MRLCMGLLLFCHAWDIAIAKSLRIGSRPSKLALVQAESVAQAIIDANPSLPTPTIVPISASGDTDGRIQDKPLAFRSVDFTGALDSALQEGRIDLAVHSLKDIPPSKRWKDSEGFQMHYPLPREDPADVLMGEFDSLQEIPAGTRIGTSSVRRQAQLLSVCPDIEVVNIRGNLDSRIRAFESGEVNGLLLAQSGLNRLKVSRPMVARIPPTEFLPGPCQGIVVAVSKLWGTDGGNGTASVEDLVPHNEAATIAAFAERAFLDSLDEISPWAGRPPLAGLMEQGTDGEEGWIFRGSLARPDGKRVVRSIGVLSGCTCTIEEAKALGTNIGSDLLRQAGDAFFDECIETRLKLGGLAMQMPTRLKGYLQWRETVLEATAFHQEAEMNAHRSMQ